MKFEINPNRPEQVRDANGELIPGAIRGDTESGLVERMKPVCERHPAPLTIDPPFRHRPDVR